MENIKVSYNVGALLAQITDIYQLRLFNWLLVKSQQATRKCDKNLNQINLQFALDVAQVDIPLSFITKDQAHAREHIRRAFELQNKIFYADFKKAAVELRAIAFPCVLKINEQRRIRFYIHRDLWLALLDFTKGWRKLNLHTIQGIRRTTTMLIYFQIAQQKTSFTIETAKLINWLHLGEGYKKRSNLIARVLKPAQEELQHADTNFTFEFSTISKSNHTDTITITPKAQAAERSEAEEFEADRQQNDLPSEVVDYLETKFNATPQDLTTLAHIMPHHTTPYATIERLAQIHTAALRAQAANPLGYLVNALKKES